MHKNRRLLVFYASIETGNHSLINRNASVEDETLKDWRFVNPKKMLSNVLVALHREENVENSPRLKRIIDACFETNISEQE